ncbi:Rieske domain-containing protein [Trichoplax sp. H2]|uniref:Rieske domain-containing protein n=1 Tax=Trichoplax adhaerens TaxID=10228 RepID=B3RZH1_TRIAD|nr:hypothetical protein TRIADDRAFT_57450 [Trichoplax adhaerens]EDV24204.1 hypothetical protein TRIADDRAFT_57450 [Trichoplax adhaerens]RDD39559.1 Rieske domain-containing protein [Trichoplax sp. H2]|eukprot:XP_002113730.1 hypothetical protein TRIADDRAFT_57450 [Trichoplax adhaerens]
MAEQLNDEYVSVGSLDLIRGRRAIKVTVNNRNLAIFNCRGILYAMDQQCYHTGGPLDMGDIEEIGGRVCIRCPWHRYVVALDNGEGLFVNEGKIKSKGLKQRVHAVKVEENSIWVKLSQFPEEVPSDYYQSEKYRAIMASAGVSIQVPTLKKN